MPATNRSESPGRTNPTNNLTLTVTSATGGAIGTVSAQGVAVLGSNIEFWSAVALSDVTTAQLNDGATITTQWFGSNSTAAANFVAISNGGIYSGATSNTLTISNVSALPYVTDTYYIRATISSVTGGAVSNSATVTAKVI